MPKKASGKIKTRTVHIPQKNGDTYVVERQTLYNPDKKYNEVLSAKLISKIPKGSDAPVATRPKKATSQKESECIGKMTASRVHVGMMEIIGHIGASSGIDDGIYDNTDTGTAQKIISIARYLLATNGQSLPGILTWQFNHPLPYEDGISEGIYHELFAKIGRDESLQQGFSGRKAEEDAGFDNDLIELRKAIEDGINIDGLSKSAQDKAKKYLHINKRGGSVHVSFNEAICRETKNYHGYFALVSNCEKEPFECLLKYRKRETVESCFETTKRHADGIRVRVWDTDTLRGRMFVQFVALCYYEYLSNEIRNIKATLGVKNGDPKHDSEINLKLENRLKSWLDNSPLYIILQWFDTVEGVNVSSKLHAKRWTTEITMQDKMFLEKIGVVMPY